MTQTIKQRLEKALHNQNQVCIHYKDRNNNQKEHIIEISHIFSSMNGKSRPYYMSAYSYLESKWVIFKISRIEVCILLDSICKQQLITWNDVDLRYFNGKQITLETAHKYDTPSSSSPKIPKTVYPKTLHFTKCMNDVICRSPLEERVYRSLNTDPMVNRFEVEPLSIPFMFENIQRTYIPDALVYKSNGQTELVEVKLSGEVHLPINQAKFKAAEAFAKTRGWNFVVRGIQAEASGYQMTGTYGWGEKNRKAPITQIDFKQTPFQFEKNTEKIMPSAWKKQSPKTGYSWLIGIFVIAILIYIFTRN